MGARTVFEHSEEVASPSGRYSAVLSSQTTGPKKGMTQAMVSEPGQGAGLVAFDSPRVAMAFSWRGDDELTVRYPKELPKPRLDLTNASYGRGGRGRVVYEAVPAAQIPPVQWTRQGTLTLLEEKKLERGVLSTFDADGRREHAYSYCDVLEPDSSSNALAAKKLQGGGESWAGIVHGLVALRAPALASKLELDPEGDALTVRSTSRAALLKVAKLVALAKKDEALLWEAVARARADGEME